MIKTGLASAGYQPEVRDLSSFQDDYGWKADDNEQDGADDGDDDDDEDEDDSDADEDGEE